MRKPALLACVLLLSAAALADDPPVVQMGALARGFALPTLGRTDIVTENRWRLRVDLDDANEYASRSNSNESILIDGEATELSLNLRYGFAPRWEAGVFVPVLAQGGGALDQIIQNWHHLWGLPNGGREDAPDGRYLYQYSRNGQMLLNVSQGSVEMGDVQASAGYRIANGLAARAMIKLPTGDASHLAGNGAFGAAAWLDGGLPLTGFLHWLTLYGSLGYSGNMAGDILEQQQKHGLAFGAAGLGLRFTPGWDAKVQVYFHGAPYRDSQLAALDHIAAPLTVSTSYRVAPHYTVSLGFQEKANLFASPDFGVHLGLAIDD
ncbi:MAG: DUF3187 family protein [Nevskia sp.]|nr:DUF3187 family protein [Nevskia sp.]